MATKKAKVVAPPSLTVEQELTLILAAALEDMLPALDPRAGYRVETRMAADAGRAKLRGYIVRLREMAG